MEYPTEWTAVILFAVILLLVSRLEATGSFVRRLWEGLTGLYQDYKLRSVKYGRESGPTVLWIAVAVVISAGLVTGAAFLDDEVIEQWAEMFCAFTLLLIAFGSLITPSPGAPNAGVRFSMASWIGLFGSMLVPVAYTVITRKAVLEQKRAGADARAADAAADEATVLNIVYTVAWWLTLSILKGWFVDFFKVQVYKFVMNTDEYITSPPTPQREEQKADSEI